jgi:hypothetical protein
VQTLRVHDPDRRPANWTEIIRPGQFAGFARLVETGLPSDADGRPFPDPAALTCLLFQSLDEARAFCETAVLAHPEIRFDVFDETGRANAPLLTIVSPSRAHTLDANPRSARRRRAVAWLLIAAAPPVLALAYSLGDVRAIFPGFLGINMILAGGRLLWFNLAVRESEREREARLDAASGVRARP